MKLNSTFRHRSFWLGLAMVVIMIYHSSVAFPSNVFPLIRQYGYAGVDVFLFASGIGCYYSLDKDPDILNFMKRRLKRLAPVYLCFMAPWLIWKNLITPLPSSAIIGNLLGLESFASWNFHFNWYISALLLFYTLLPYLKRLADSLHGLWSQILVLTIIFMVSVSFWDTNNWNIVILSRLPILYLGVFYGKLGRADFVLKKSHLLLHALAAGIGCLVLYRMRYAPIEIMWFRGFYWYPVLLIIPGICLAMSGFGTFLLGRKILKPIYLLLEKVGIYSFELYLVHIFLFEQITPKICLSFPEIPAGRFWLMAWTSVIPLSFLLNKAAKILSFLTKKCLLSANKDQP